MDTFPLKLKELIKTILSDNNISSWRIQGQNDLILSIRFENNNSTSMHSDLNQYYRSKPPSCIHRDKARQQQYINKRYSIANQTDSGLCCSTDQFRNTFDPSAEIYTPKKNSDYPPKAEAFVNKPMCEEAQDYFKCDNSTPIKSWNDSIKTKDTMPLDAVVSKTTTNLTPGSLGLHMTQS